MSVLFVILGILLIAGGISCIFTPIATMLSAGYIIGILLLVFGIIGIIRDIREKGDVLEWILHILAIIVGIVAIVRPGGTLVIDGLLIFFLAAFFLVMGVVEIVMAFKTKAINKTWYLGLIVGILAVIVGIICFVYPSIAAITVGVLIGFFFIEIGISLISFATVSGDEA